MPRAFLFVHVVIPHTWGAVGAASTTQAIRAPKKSTVNFIVERRVIVLNNSCLFTRTYIPHVDIQVAVRILEIGMLVK